MNVKSHSHQQTAGGVKTIPISLNFIPSTTWLVKVRRLTGSPLGYILGYSVGFVICQLLDNWFFGNSALSGVLQMALKGFFIGVGVYSIRRIIAARVTRRSR